MDPVSEFEAAKRQADVEHARATERRRLEELHGDFVQIGLVFTPRGGLAELLAEMRGSMRFDQEGRIVQIADETYLAGKGLPHGELKSSWSKWGRHQRRHLAAYESTHPEGVRFMTLDTAGSYSTTYGHALHDGRFAMGWVPKSRDLDENSLKGIALVVARGSYR